jgi:hypothetical protein
MMNMAGHFPAGLNKGTMKSSPGQFGVKHLVSQNSPCV